MNEVGEPVQIPHHLVMDIFDKGYAFMPNIHGQMIRLTIDDLRFKKEDIIKLANDMGWQLPQEIQK
jgi:hypothetical protein